MAPLMIVFAAALAAVTRLGAARPMAASPAAARSLLNVSETLPLPLPLPYPVTMNAINSTSPPPPSPSPCAGTFSYSVNGSASSSLPVSALVATIAAYSSAASLVISLCEGTVLDAAALGVSSSPLLNLSSIVGNFTLACAVVVTPPACAIDGGGVYQLVLIGFQQGTPYFMLSGLELRNGFAANGGAVDVATIGSRLSVAGDRFNGNNASVRPLLCVAPPPPAPYLHRAARSRATQATGGAIYIRYDAGVDATGATFDGNSAGVSVRSRTMPAAPHDTELCRAARSRCSRRSPWDSSLRPQRSQGTTRVTCVTGDQRHRSRLTWSHNSVAEQWTSRYLS